MKHGCVVIADIHQNMLEGIRSLLDTEFETTVMVASLASLKKAVADLKPDLVVMDVSMPCPDGINVVREFIDSCPSTRLIVMSVHDEQSVVDKVIGSGASGFVLKRQAANDLLPAVKDVLGGQTYISKVIQKAN